MKYRLTIAVVAFAAALSAFAQDTPKWDVTNPGFPADTVTFTQTEGTWMNLDVSPDGREIAFDLLGDIYVMPVDGGTARLLRGGTAWEVQPRFSPDGRWISFTSDRAGGDNIWIMDREGENLHQVTSEDFRLLNNAAWTPDSEYLIARKHFTSRRSLGAGEMWLYHRSGGKGIQLTERKNDQQDVNEPVVSPDGRYLYFSEDWSGGSTFQYNKDPNTQIYVIRRLDLETGDLKNVITGPGGAVRPQLSPDGEYLSFVRRVRDQTVLYLHRLATGQQWPVYTGLDKDQQEAWAIFGLYPNYAWTPDSRAVVFWAGGKIHRLDIASRQAVEIPFEAEASHAIATALRFRQEAHPAEFQSRLLKDVVTTPDGKTVLFSAVGKIWKAPAGGGAAERLTQDEGLHEFDPDVSPDGRHVVYATWNDTAKGAIRKIRLRGGKSTILTERKGYYYTPRWAPDGTIIVYQRSGGNSLLGYAFGVEPGLYWIAESGGVGNRITEAGYNPRFNRSGDRIHYMTWSGGKAALKSVTLDGGHERTLFSSQYATDIVVSPDERWVAFQELFNLYVTPYPQTGESLDLSAKSSAIPVRQITRDAGTYVHWSADSKSLHWVIGPEYFTRRLDETFAFVEGAPDSLPAIDTTGVELELFLTSDQPEGRIALSGARIITMNGDTVIDSGVVLIEGNRIAAVGQAGDVAIPSGARTIDVSGHTIMPGIVDAHAHMGHFVNGATPQSNWPYLANLAFGITTTHDPSATTEVVFTQSEMVRAGLLVGPRVFSTGTILYGAEGNFKAVINSLDDARSHLRRMKAVGAFSVKSYNQPRRDQRQQVIQAARELEMNVYPEGGSFFFHNMSMILDGHTGIEHNIPVVPAYSDVLNLWGASGTGYTPTLVVSYGSQSGQRYWYQHTNVWENERLLSFVPRAIVDPLARRRTMAPEDEYGHIQNAETCKALFDRGVTVNVGGHGEMQGLAPHWELWMLVQGGMTPLEALRCATQNGADYIGMGDQLGSIEAGKLADLVVLDGNPLDDIRESEAVRYVMANGRFYDAGTMNEIAPKPRQRMPLYWEQGGASESFIWDEETGFGLPGCGCGRH